VSQAGYGQVYTIMSVEMGGLEGGLGKFDIFLSNF